MTENLKATRYKLNIYTYVCMHILCTYIWYVCWCMHIFKYMHMHINAHNCPHFSTSGSIVYILFSTSFGYITWLCSLSCIYWSYYYIKQNNPK